MLEVHTLLWNDVTEFSFTAEDLAPLVNQRDRYRVHEHSSVETFLTNAHSADVVLTWEFDSNWYEHCPTLQLIMTPAAGRDWVMPSPDNAVEVRHGTFHGPILAESLIEALLFMNRRMKTMMDNYRHQGWDRNLQTGSALLSEQTVVIVGYGSIGTTCGQLISALGANVIGVRRQAVGDIDGIPIVGVNQLDEVLPQADHLVLLLPGDASTRGFMNAERLQRCSPGAFVYNFGRGGALLTADLMAAIDHLGGAYLDVTEDEPLPATSPLWHHEKIMITPHSSCVTSSYRARFIQEVDQALRERIRGA